MTRTMAPNRVAPSLMAASSSSLGIVSKKLRSSQTASGVVKLR